MRVVREQAAPRGTTTDPGAPLAPVRAVPVVPVPAGPADVVRVVAHGEALALVGRLDVHAAADVRLALVDHLAAGSGPLVVDLAGITVVDATGLGVLVGAHRRAGRAGRALVLQDPSPTVARVLLLTRLERVLRVERSSALA